MMRTKQSSGVRGWCAVQYVPCRSQRCMCGCCRLGPSLDPSCRSTLKKFPPSPPLPSPKKKRPAQAVCGSRLGELASHTACLSPISGGWSVQLQRVACHCICIQGEPRRASDCATWQQLRFGLERGKDKRRDFPSSVRKNDFIRCLPCLWSPPHVTTHLG